MMDREPVEHEFKCWPPYFGAIMDGRKRFEFRKTRGEAFQTFRVGDTLWLREWTPDDERYTGRDIRVLVTYVLEGPTFDVPTGHAILSIDLLDTDREEMSYEEKLDWYTPMASGAVESWALKFGRPVTPAKWIANVFGFIAKNYMAIRKLQKRTDRLEEAIASHGIKEDAR